MKNRPLHRQVLLFLGVAFAGQMQAQTDAAAAVIRQAFRNNSSSYVQEKLFVHTDKNNYFPGEICWFRIYDVDVTDHRPLHVSKIAYVELLDRSNLPVVQEKISLKPGEAGGSFIIPARVVSGDYRFRAYTRWMKNFSAEYFFEKAIHITNPDKPVDDSVAKATPQYDAQFFPEGGNLVQNVESKLGFRVTDSYGRGQRFEGQLINEAGDTLLRFQPLVLGMGHFSFTPAPGHRYRGMIRFADGRQLIRDLPPAFPSGYVMRLSPVDKNRLSITVRAIATGESDAVSLFVHTRGAIKKLESGRLQNGQWVFSMATDDLGDGISQFTVFNGSGKPVCERLYFKYPEKQLRIQASIPGKEFATRKEIQLGLLSAGSDGKPIAADMSMAVYLLDSLQPQDASDISQYLYLTGDIRGRVESPEYYFNSNQEAREEAMDNLMLTQGWRRFQWDRVMLNRPPAIVYAPEYDGHILEGRLVNNKSGAPVRGVDAFLSVPSTRTEFRTTRTDSAGRVKFELDDFYESQEIIVQTDPNDDSTGHFEMSNPFSTAYPPFPMASPAVSGKHPLDLTDQSVRAQVQRVYAGTRWQQFRMPVLDTNTFYVTPDEKYLLDDYTRFQTMEEVFREYVHSVNVIKRRDKFQLYVFNPAMKDFFSGKPLILMDGVPVFDADEVFHQDPMKIRRIDLVTQGYLLGNSMFNGIVNITSYRGDLDGFTLDPRATVVDYPGIPGQREFFSPVYETEDQVESRKPDFRTLLDWVPQIKTDDSGKESIRFYSSDLPGKYVAVIQGITSSGESGSQSIYFTIKK